MRQREVEEGMRRTLLRGMSAMNMEAMYVLNGGSESDPRCEGSRTGAGAGSGVGRRGVSGSGGGGFSSNRTAPSFSSGVSSTTGRLRLEVFVCCARLIPLTTSSVFFCFFPIVGFIRIHEL